MVQEGAEHRGGNGDVGNGTVRYPPAREETKAEEPQERPVRVTGQAVDGVDDGSAACNMEQGNTEGKGKRDGSMHAVTHVQSPPRVEAIALHPQHIHTNTGCQGRHCAVGTGKGRRRDADGERKHHQRTQRTAAYQHRQQAVPRIGFRVLTTRLGAKASENGAGWIFFFAKTPRKSQITKITLLSIFLKIKMPAFHNAGISTQKMKNSKKHTYK